MRLRRTFVVLFLLCAAVFAQRHKFDVNTETPEGQLLAKAGQGTDDAAKVPLYEEFLSKYPKHTAVPWVYDQLVPLYLKAGEFDKTIAGAEASLAVDGANPVIAYHALQASEKKNDPAGIKKWSAATEQAAKKVLALPKPTEEDDVEAWKRDVDYSQQVVKRTEYSLYAAAIQAQDPKVTVDLLDELERRNPSSEYLGQASSRYFLALRQTGNEAKAFQVAEKALAKDPNNEDMLVVAASHYMDAKSKDPEKVLSYSSKLVEVMSAKAAPEGVAAADWDKKKTSLIGLGHWMQGMTYGGQNKWALSDKSFRAALPHIQGNDELLAPAYFYLGLSNFRMAEGPKGNKSLMPEAKRFTQLCAGIKSGYQASAQKNLAAMAGK